jgi:hypothetical protein
MQTAAALEVNHTQISVSRLMTNFVNRSQVCFALFMVVITLYECTQHVYDGYRFQLCNNSTNASRHINLQFCHSLPS